MITPIDINRVDIFSPKRPKQRIEWDIYQGISLVYGGKYRPRVWNAQTFTYEVGGVCDYCGIDNCIDYSYCGEGKSYLNEDKEYV